MVAEKKDKKITLYISSVYTVVWEISSVEYFVRKFFLQSNFRRTSLAENFQLFNVFVVKHISCVKFLAVRLIDENFPDYGTADVLYFSHVPPYLKLSFAETLAPSVRAINTWSQLNINCEGKVN